MKVMRDGHWTRRDILGGMAAAAVSIPLTGKAHGAGSSTFPVVVDVAFDTRPILKELKRRGVTTVFRYYAYKDDQWPGKLIVPDEAKAIHDSGMGLGVVYQYHNNVLENLTARRGRIDAEHALSFGTQVIGQPDGSAIYFGVDGDWPSSSGMARIQVYFETINEVIAASGAKRIIGVYGSGKTCAFLRERNLASLFWLPKSTGWSGVPAFYNSNSWSMYQHAQGVKVGSIALDTNWANPAINSVGAFKRSGPASVGQPAAMLDQRRFVTQATALRRGPNASSTKLSTLSKRRNLAVLEEAEGWAAVDLDEDGVRDGYCRAADLGPVTRMP